MGRDRAVDPRPLEAAHGRQRGARSESAQAFLLRGIGNSHVRRLFLLLAEEEYQVGKEGENAFFGILVRLEAADVMSLSDVVGET